MSLAFVFPGQGSQAVGMLSALAEQFSEVEGTQCRSFETVTPIDVIEVDFNDLPPSIKLIEE